MARIVAHAGPGEGPALQPWPLLAWTVEHGVVTEDRQVPVEEIAILAATGADPAEIAVQLGTSPAHVEQALSYLRSLPA